MSDQVNSSRTRLARRPVAVRRVHRTRTGRRLIALLATAAAAVPFTLAASGAPARASSFTISAKRGIIRAGHLPQVGRLAIPHRALPDAVLHQAYSFQFHVRDTHAVGHIPVRRARRAAAPDRNPQHRDPQR
jgi:hypothetical protein